jgi:hypothetical protein
MRRLIIATTALLSVGTANAIQVGDRVDNFRLLDQRGISHELYYLSDMKAVVLLAHRNDCDAAQPSVAQLDRIRQQYKDRGVAALMINADLKTDRDAIARDIAGSTQSLPVLMDSLQLISESLAFTRSGEALVIDPKTWIVKYRGGIDGAATALDAAIAGQDVKPERSSFKGCKIKLPQHRKQRAHAKISYEKTVAPILMDKCVACHRQGGIGPWQMSSYDVVRGFAPMIREVLRTERMPPWHADPHYGVFSNDRSLSAEQTKTLVHWIEAGARKDKRGKDPLASYSQTWSEWTLGKPDLIVEIPAFNVPATGSIPYQRPVVKNPLGKDVWLRAIEFTPTNRGVVHHILAGLTGQKVTSSLSGLESLTAMGVYVPGDVPHALPQETGVLIPKNSNFVFQMHYTANGKAVSETTRVGLYFSTEPPRYPMRNTVLLDPNLRIPAQTKEHSAFVERVFDRDVLVYTLMAHSHVRGKSAAYIATYPDGRKETLLSVPHYDFNWQTSYELREPKLLPKGTKLVYYSAYDNSIQNKANPDPTSEVRWGEQTWEEMIYGDVRFRYLDEVNQPAPQLSALP